MSTGSLPPLDALRLLPGASPDAGPDPLEFIYGLPPSPPAGLPDAALPPQPPEYSAPAMLPVPKLGVWDRFSTALASVPRFNGAMPMEGPGQAFARGLVGGVAGGISSAGAERMKRAEQQRVEMNATNKSESDRNYATAVETWKAKLMRYYKTQADRDGMILVTKQMEQELKLPTGSAGQWLPVMDLANKKSQADRTAREDAADPLVPITEDAVAKWMGAKIGDLAKRSEIASAHKDMKPSGSGGSGMFGNAFDPASIAAGIHDGSMPANPSFYTRGAWNSIASVLHTKYHEDVTKLVLNYGAIRQAIQSMNQPQMASYRAAIKKVVPTIDYTESLVDQLERIIPIGQVKELNRLQLAAIARGKGDWVTKAKLTPEQTLEAANLATKIIGQISGPVETEMGTVYTRGAALTDEGRKAVRAQISSDMGTSNIKAAFQAMRRDVSMADNALNEVAGWSPWNTSASVGGFDLGNRKLPPPPSEHDMIPDR